MAGGTRAYRPITVTSQPIDGTAEEGLPMNEPDDLLTTAELVVILQARLYFRESARTPSGRASPFGVTCR
jgi:hypothetical protein